MVCAEHGTGRVESCLEQENIELELIFFLVNLGKNSTPLTGFANQGETTSFLFQTVRLETALLFGSSRLLSQT